MEWIEQTDAIKMVRWGAYLPDDNKENFVLIEKGKSIIGEILDISMRDLQNDEGETVQKPSITMRIDGTEDEQVKFITPKRLQTALGLNPNWKKNKVAEIGDLVKIQYLGVNKEVKGKPHLFEVYWAKK